MSRRRMPRAIRRGATLAVLALAVAMPASAAAHSVEIEVDAQSTPLNSGFYSIAYVCSAGALDAVSVSISCHNTALACPGPFCATDGGFITNQSYSVTATVYVTFLDGHRAGPLTCTLSAPPSRLVATKHCSVFVP